MRGGLGRGKAPLLGAFLLAIGCSDSSTDALIAQLRGADPKARLAAARSLAERRDDAADAVAGLTTAVGDAEPAVRELAITTLGEIGPEAEASLPALEQALHDENTSVRTAAALAIDSIEPNSRIHWPVLIEALRRGDGPVFLAIGRTGERGAWAVPTLAALLSERRPTIRCSQLTHWEELAPRRTTPSAHSSNACATLRQVCEKRRKKRCGKLMRRTLVNPMFPLPFREGLGEGSTSVSPS